MFDLIVGMRHWLLERFDELLRRLHVLALILFIYLVNDLHLLWNNNIDRHYAERCGQVYEAALRLTAARLYFHLSHAFYLHRYSLWCGRRLTIIHLPVTRTNLQNKNSV